MKKIIKYSNFAKYVIANNTEVNIDLRIKSFVNGQRINCHAFDELTNSSMNEVNSRTTDQNKPLTCFMTFFVKINGVESIRDYDLSNYIGKNIPYYIDIMNIKDVNGVSLLESGTITTTSIMYKNCLLSFEATNSIKYKSDKFSFYLKPSDNIEIIEQGPVEPERLGDIVNHNQQDAKIYLDNIQPSIFDRAYTCSAGIGLMIHYVDYNDVEYTTTTGYINVNDNYSLSYYDSSIIVKKIWVSDLYEEFADSNIYFTQEPG